MKTLHVLRHAKSRRDDPKLDDEERPLSSRGVQDAMAMAEHCAQSGVRPDLVLCSSSVRTRATLALLIPYLPVARIQIERGLYLASVGGLFARVAEVDDDTDSVLLIGHNDGLHDFAVALAGTGDAGLRQRLMAKFPTGALASFALTIPTWHRIEPATGELIGLTTPKELRC